ncbi:helix-turn-helix domain-containing protein [Candidatus Daviesbacteria bacterium]|nr:helix-turn-helix domain-containing protein [Candidatus Daviesbacteria bacterium]
MWVKVGRNIKHCRKWKGLTPEELASRARINLKRYKRMEKAIVQDITIVEAFNIKDALGVSQEEILPLLG